jgi:putative endonuclease
MFYLYIIHSSSSEKFYVGHSENPWERILQHNEDSSDKYTGKYQNWELKAFFQVSENKEDALSIEKFIKRQKTKKLVQKLVDSNFVPKGELSMLTRVSLVKPF